MRRAVFLDRDGVINDSCVDAGVAKPPASLADLRIAPDAADALARLVVARYTLVVVTNQPDIARRATSLETVEAIHELLRERLPIDAFYCCPHDEGEGCGCRKPAPGLLLRAAREWGIDLEESWLIGDRWVDIAAGHAAGVRSVLLAREYSWNATSSGAPPANLAPDRRGQTLLECVELILETG